jgi:hypothetical protein
MFSGTVRRNISLAADGSVGICGWVHDTCAETVREWPAVSSGFSALP